MLERDSTDIAICVCDRDGLVRTLERNVSYVALTIMLREARTRKQDGEVRRIDLNEYTYIYYDKDSD